MLTVVFTHWNRTANLSQPLCMWRTINIMLQYYPILKIPLAPAKLHYLLVQHLRIHIYTKWNL